MSALDDPEDGPSNVLPPTNPHASEEPISIPPAPIQPFHAREASTEPAPAIDAEAMAALVIAALSPELKTIGISLAAIKLTVDHLSEEMVESRTWQREADATLTAINNGLTGAFNIASNAVTAARDAANGMLELDGKIGDLRRDFSHWRNEFDRSVGGRLVKLEDWMRDSGAGEDDGSIAAAAKGAAGE